jgi:Uri superfamily endonuclease
MRGRSQTEKKKNLEGNTLHKERIDREVPRESGVYSIGIEITYPIEVSIRTDSHELEAGTYVYTGSALGRSSNLHARISRHLTVGKKAHWHIDQITNSKHTSVFLIVFSKTSQREECRVNHAIAETSQGEAPIPGFGSSDCRSGCQSHLLFLKEKEVTPIIVEAFKRHGLTPKVLEIGKEKDQTEK